MDDDQFRRFIDELKDKADITQVINETGTDYKLNTQRHGKYFMGVVHDSLCVDPDKQIYTWFSKGGRSKGGNESGDVFVWLERYGHMYFWQAALYLAEKYDVRVPSGGPAAGVEDAARAKAYRAKVEAFEVACSWFEGQLWSHQGALGYARGRGWTDETIKSARIGYSNPQKAKELVGELLMYEIDIKSPEVVMMVGMKGGVKEWCKGQGIEGQENWLEQNRIWGLVDFPRLIYPHIWRGRVMYFSARNLKWEGGAGEGRLIGEDDKSKKGFNTPRALAGERQRYFNCAFRNGVEQVVLVEGQADAITLGQWGIPAVALVGLSMDEQLARMIDKCKQKYVAMDNDERGLAARWRVAELLGPMARMMRWPGMFEGKPVKDANDWLVAMVSSGLGYEIEGDMKS